MTSHTPPAGPRTASVAADPQSSDEQGERAGGPPAGTEREARPSEPTEHGENPETREGGAEASSFRLVHLLTPLAAFFGARLVGLLATALAAHVRDLPLSMVFGAWDGRWYLRLALEGYPSVVGSGDFYSGDVSQVQSTIAFFPLFPGLARGVMEITGMGPAEAELIVGFVAGACATVLVWALAREIYDRATADRAAVLFAFAPGAVVLSMLYAEGLAIALVAGCLLMLRRRQWVVAGLLAALATATRPNALVVVGVCLWTAGVAVHQRREWRALAAPLLAPLGFVGYCAFLGFHTGDFSAWFDVQRRGWGERTDFGLRSLELAVEFVQDPLGDAYVLLYGVSLVAAVLMLALFLRRPRPPADLTLFALGVIGLSLASATLNLRPRFVFFAFPLVIVLARWSRGRTFGVLAGTSGGLLGLLGVFYFLEEVYYP